MNRNDMNHREAVDYINSHREAVGREPLTTLNAVEVERHMALINENAPYGNDPWGVEN